MKSERTFGVEVEFTSCEESMSWVAGQIKRNLPEQYQEVYQVMSEGYNHDTRSYWKVTTDSSCGYELVSPILQGKAGLNEAREIINALSKVQGVNVNRKCGVHVHVALQGFDGYQIGNLLKNYSKYQDEISKALPKSRRGMNNSYCYGLNKYAAENCISNSDYTEAYNKWVDDNRGMESRREQCSACEGGAQCDQCYENNRNTQSRQNRDFRISSQFIEAGRKTLFNKVSEIQSLWKSGAYSDSDAFRKYHRWFGTRYMTLNIECYVRYGTVEFRQHSGSLCSEKIGNWICFCTNLVDRSAKVKFVQFVKDVAPMKNFANIFGEQQSRSILKYFESRALGFGFPEVNGAYTHATSMRRV